MRLFSPEMPPTAGLPLAARDLAPPWRGDFAARAAAWLDLDAALLTSSGTAALVIALRTLQTLAPTRSTVVIPAYTCPLVPRAVQFAGLRVRLCDLADGHFDLDPVALAAACDDDTLAVLPTHLAGRVADVAATRVCADRVGAFVIEDAAQAFGARSGNTSVGLAGDIGFFSFAVGKGLSLYEGGLLVARDPALRAALRRTAATLARARPDRELRRVLELAGYAAVYRPRLLGPAYGRPLRRALARGDVIAAVRDDQQAPIRLDRVGTLRQTAGGRALTRLHAFHARLHAQAAARLPMLAALPGVRVYADSGHAHGVWPFLLLHLPSRDRRDAALARLWPAGLGVTRLFAHALPDYPFLRDVVPATAMPQARDFAARTLTISNSPWLDDARFARIVDGLQQTLHPAAETGAR